MRTTAPTSRTRRRARPRSARSSLPVRLSLLGEFRVQVGDRAHVLPRAARRLVALVALHRPSISRTRSAFLLTPHLEPTSAAGSLRATIARLRALGPPLLATDATTLRLAPQVQVDVATLEAAVGSNRADDLADPELAALLGAELLPGWDDEWVVFERERLHELSLQALERHARAYADGGDVAAAITTVYTALRVDPLRETAARLLIEFQLRAGNQAQAVRAFMQFRDRLMHAMGVEPTEATVATVRPLLNRVRL